MLGSGKNLAPPPPFPAQRRPIAIQNHGLLSPSESEVSLSSRSSSTPLSTDNEDLVARVAVDATGGAHAAAAASSRMVCPICSEEMVREEHMPKKSVRRQALMLSGDALATEPVAIYFRPSNAFDTT